VDPYGRLVCPDYPSDVLESSSFRLQ
jgi:hypothetical protein